MPLLKYEGRLTVEDYFKVGDLLDRYGLLDVMHAVCIWRMQEQAYTEAIHQGLADVAKGRKKN